MDEAIRAYVEMPFILAIWLSVSDFTGLVYSIVMHGLYGQTFGKLVFQVKVVDKSEKPLVMKQASYRDDVPILQQASRR